MVKLILDTNQIVEKDWRLRSAAIRLIEKAVELDLVSVVVPQIVVEETCNKFRQRLEAIIKSTTEKKAGIERLIDSKIPLLIPKIDLESKKYEAYLDHRLKELKVIRTSYTDIDHEWLVPRALGTRRPFQRRDRGYRDALLWHAVLEDVASTDHHTYFVSENKSDFGDEKGDFHPQLMDDLDEAGLKEYVTYMHDIYSFVENVVKPALQQVPNPLTVVDFERLFEEHLDSIIDQINREVDRQGLANVPNELFEGGSYIDGLSMSSAEPVDAYALDGTSLYMEFSVLVEASFDQTVYLPDAIWISEEWNMGITGGEEKYIELSFTLTVPVTISVVRSTEEGVGPEVSVELREFYGFCLNCKHPVLSDAAERCSNCNRALF